MLTRKHLHRHHVIDKMEERGEEITGVQADECLQTLRSCIPVRAFRERVEQMAWLLLSVAGILEIAFAYFMKSSYGFTRLTPALLTIVAALASIVLLSISLRTLPVGTGYAAWTGIGAAGTAILGITILGESAAPLRLLCIGCILTGVIGLKMVSPD